MKDNKGNLAASESVSDTPAVSRAFDKAVAAGITMYAWIGEDEHGSGEVGLKQAMVPAGMVPLAAMGHHLDRLTKVAPAMELQARAYGKKIRLCKFAMVEVVQETGAGE